MHRFTLPDMSCGHCVAAITEALQAADAQARVGVDLQTKTAQVDSALPRDALATALTEAGYPPASAPTPI
ncbi:heavy-metal-associated domain-containing protein [Roseateles sp. P5_E7]